MDFWFSFVANITKRNLFGLDLVVLLDLELVSYCFKLKPFSYCSYFLHFLNKCSLLLFCFFIDNGHASVNFISSSIIIIIILLPVLSFNGSHL